MNFRRPLPCAMLIGSSLLSLLASTSPAQENRHIVSAPPLTPQEQLKKFHLPPGFEIQLVAAEPDVPKPINLSFNDQGQLLVSGSVEYPYPVTSGEGRDTVTLLGDLDENGKARLIKKVVTGLNIPIGVLALRDGAMVFSIPSILHATDTNGDGVADKKDVLLTGFGSDDTHGLSSSFRSWVDGWIYACHGFRNTSNVKSTPENTLVMNSGNTYRLKLDGSLEQFTHGQVNPFGMAFDPLGNLYTSDCHTKPIYMLLRGAYYPHFGNKTHDGLGFGPEMCKHNHGSTGIAGIAYYAADHFPAEYRDNLFIGNPITARVNRDTLKPHGSTYEAVEQPDFIACDDAWFRPVDVQLGPDGALYIADFYNRIIGHYEVPLDHPQRDRHSGRVWRVVYRGTDGKAAPPQPMTDLEQATPEALVALLGHVNLLVRTKATNQLVERIGKPAVELVRQQWANKPSPEALAHGLWVVERLAGLTDAEIAQLNQSASPLVRVHLQKALAERPTSRFPAAAVRRSLADADPFVRRAAADALSRHPHQENVAPLLLAWSTTDAADTHLTHTLRMSLRNQLLPIGTFAEVAKSFGQQPPNMARLAEISLGAANAEAADFLFTALRTQQVPAHLNSAAQRHVVRFLQADQLPAFYEWADSFRQRPQGEQREVVSTLWKAHQERGVPVPPAMRKWADDLAEKLLASKQPKEVTFGLELAQEVKLASAFPRVAELAATANSGGLRNAAIDACVSLDRDKSVAVLATIVGNGDEALAVRQKAATTLGTVQTTPAREELVRHLRTAPDPLAITLAAALAGNKDGGELLFQALSQGKANRRLLLDRNVRERLPRSGLPDWEARAAKITAGLPPVDERLLKLVDERRQQYLKAETDVARGALVYQKICAKCHQVNGQGAKIGPQLDGVGNRGLQRVLEDVLDPSRNIDEAFRTTQVTTNDGRLVSGLALRTDGEVLVLADAEGKEVRIPLADIDERGQTNLSPMPANVSELLKEPEFYDLIRYLLEQRQVVLPAGSSTGEKPGK